MIIGVLLIPTKKKPPIKRYDDKVIQFVCGKPMLVDKEQDLKDINGDFGQRRAEESPAPSCGSFPSTT